MNITAGWKGCGCEREVTRNYLNLIDLLNGHARIFIPHSLLALRSFTVRVHSQYSLGQVYRIVIEIGGFWFLKRTRGSERSKGRVYWVPSWRRYVMS